MSIYSELIAKHGTLEEFTAAVGGPDVELLPCPFCGARAELIAEIEEPLETPRFWHVSCSKGCASGWTAGVKSRVIEKWNTRAGSNEWVSERLPTEKGIYLLTCPTWGRLEVEVARWDGVFWELLRTKVELSATRPDAWMPLPQPYKPSGLHPTDAQVNANEKGENASAKTSS